MSLQAGLLAPSCSWLAPFTLFRHFSPGATPTGSPVPTYFSSHGMAILSALGVLWISLIFAAYLIIFGSRALHRGESVPVPESDKTPTVRIHGALGTELGIYWFAVTSYFFFMKGRPIPARWLAPFGLLLAMGVLMLAHRQKFS